MNDKEAIQLLEKSEKRIDELKENVAFSKEHIKWVSDSLFLLEDIFGKNSRIFITFAGLDFQFKGTIVATHYDMEPRKAIKDRQSYLQDLGIAQGLFLSGIDLIKRKGIEQVFEGKDTPKEASEIMRIVSIVENSLRRAIRNLPLKEKEIQDALETLFIGAGLEFTREKEHIIYSTKTYIPDFTFNKIETLVEVKFCTDASKEKELISEINDDILAYKTKYPNLIFVVYDIGIIRDQDQFKKAFEKQNSIIAKIIKH
jgi:hypothetical protein